MRIEKPKEIKAKPTKYMPPKPAKNPFAAKKGKGKSYGY